METYLKMQMNNTDKFIEDISTSFQLKHGRASCYAFPPFDVAKLIYNIYYLFNQKNTKEPILIVVDCYATRKKIIDYFHSKDMNSSNGYNYTILSVDYIKKDYNYKYKFIVTVGINNNSDIIIKLSNSAKFILAIITENIMDNNFIIKIRNVLPEIKSSVNATNIKHDRIYSPVEIRQLNVNLNEEDMELYNKYSDYISTSISIFGDFDTIEKARIGDARINLSSSEVRDMIAKNNGWSSTLDTSIDFNKQIDAIYNPNALYERANCVYTIMRQRRDLLTDNVAKLEVIKKLVDENPNKKILIISKRGEYAASITKYLNKDNVVCVDYHDKIESVPIIDNCTGDYIRYKSGEHKGEIKLFASQYLSNYNLEGFNLHKVNCLSIKNSSDIKLKTAIDLAIFTSPLCDNIIDFKRRFVNVDFNTTPNNLYLLYCSNTLEKDKLYKESNKYLFTIINNYDKCIEYDENNGNIIC